MSGTAAESAGGLLLTRVARARPDVPNGKPLGRHVQTASQRKAAAATPSPGDTRAPRAALRAVAVVAVSAGIVGTIALPSYGIAPDELHSGGLRAGAAHRPEVQSFVASAHSEPADATRHEISATTVEELEAARKKQRAEELEFAAAKQAALDAAAAGLPVAKVAPASDAATPAPPAIPDEAPPAESGSIVALARQFLGVPYVFGGASPAGFDCSGLVLYVYARFGIALPHSSLQQGAGGARVSDPVPGDLVVVDGGNHIGIYSGNGHMIDAPMPGRVVNERPIYTSNHFFVRY
jgi:peptidoglycan DL-endopeptidase CwlO